MEDVESVQYWLFNTDETEGVGIGKHEIMLSKQVIAAHGLCRGKGAELTLNQPQPGDVIFYYRARYGFVGSAVATDQFAISTDEIFDARREFLRPVGQVKKLDEREVISANEVYAATGQRTSYRHIVSRIHSPEICEYLLDRFKIVKPLPDKKKKRPSLSNRGGFQLNPEKRARVEKAAVDVVTNIYREAGWNVESVELEKVGYDLHCTKGAKVNCVEVKGTSGQFDEFILTANELAKAKTDRDFVLYVVTNALIKPVPTKYTAKQFLAKFELKPLAYRAKLKR